jgi:hypothetical protein
MNEIALKSGNRIVAAMARSGCVSNETVQWAVSSDERPELGRGAGKLS